MVKISIVMPVYNGAEFLQKSIESVSKQTLKDIELICVDDGSTDNSINVLNNLKEKYDFIKIITQENNGAGSARNKGIENATGEYIAFLDADDVFYDDDALKKMYQSNSNNVEMVSANLLMINNNDELEGNFFYDMNDYMYFSKEELIDPQDYGVPLSFYKSIFKREFLLNNNIIFPDFRRGQDPPFLAKILTLVDKIQTVPVTLYGHYFRISGGAENKIDTPEKLRGYMQHFKDTCDILADGGLNDLSDFYKIHLFRYLTRDENINNSEVYELFEEMYGLDNQTFDESDFNYPRFIVPAYFYFINKYASEEFYRIANKKFLSINIYDTFAITEDIIDKYLLVIYSYSFNDFKLNYDKYLENNLKFKDEFMKFKIEKFIFNLNLIKSRNLFNNTQMILKQNQFWKNKRLTKAMIKKCIRIIDNGYGSYFGTLIKYEVSSLEQFDDSKHLISLLNARLDKHDFTTIDKEIEDLNIAYVLHGFPIHSETFVINEIKWLKENGYNVIVFSHDAPYKPVKIDFHVRNIRFNNQTELESLLIEHDIDLMHTHFVYPIATHFTYPIAERLRIPFTVFAHAFDIFVTENDENNNIDEISKSKYCKAIFTLSNFHKNYLVERGVPEEKIIITKQATSYELSPIQEKHNKIINIVSVSRFVEKKGLDVLIDAAKLLENENYEFSIYGFGDLEVNLQAQINELNCKNISIKGELAPNDVKDILTDSDLLVAPCKVAENGDMDGFPTVIFEAMAVGLPILTTNVSAIPEIIEDGVNGFICEPNNPEKLALKIKEISQKSNEDLLKIRKQAQDDVKNISSVEKTMKFFLSIIGG